MKFISKIARTVVMAAIGMVAPVGVALAQETYAVTKYEYMKADGAETNGLSFGLSGRYTSGFSYDMELLSTGTGGASMTGADIDLGYRVGGIAGPMTIYEYRDVAGGGSDQVLFGIEGGTEIFETQASARLLFDTDDQDVYRLGIARSMTSMLTSP